MKAHKTDKGRLAGKHECPECHSKLDGFAGIENDKEAPRNGDLSICVYCGAGLIVRREKWASLTVDEMLEAMSDGRFKRAYDAVQAFRKARQS
jgi:hypothetical protein